MRSSLAGPFALLCAAGGWLTADLAGLRYGSGDEVMLRGLLLLLTPIVATFVGWMVAPKGKASGGRFLLVTLVGGAVNGALIGLSLKFPAGVVGGAIVGVFAGAGFLPFLAPAFVVAFLTRGRVGSLLAKVERRGVWAASFAGVALGTLVPRFLGQPRGPSSVLTETEIVMAGSALAGAAILALSGARDFARLWRLATIALVPRTSRAVGERVDLGVGYGPAGEEEIATAATYRDGGMVREYTGSVARLRVAAQNQLGLLVLCVAAEIAVLALQALTPVH